MTPRKRTVNSAVPVAEQRSFSTGNATNARVAPRLRVCLVTTEFHGLFKNGGIGTANTGLALALAQEGYDVTVAFADADQAGPRVKEGNFPELQDYYRKLSVALDYVPTTPDLPKAFDDGRSASYCVYLYLKSHPFDVVYFNDCGGHGYFPLLAKHTGVFREAPRMYVVAHGPHEWVLELNSLRYWNREPVISSFLERRCAELADALISPSQHLVDWMVSHGWVLPPTVEVLQNIVRLPNSLVPATRSLKPGKTTELVFFGRLEVRKGIELFCDAIDSLNRTSDLSQIKITFMGKFSAVAGLHSGIYVVERARCWRSSLRVLSTFDQEEALTYLNRAGVLAVIPSYAENSPCVVAECIQLGIPFVATSSGGTIELVAPADRDDCLVPTDVDALAASLDRILRAGHRSAHMAVSQDVSVARWLQLTSGGIDRKTQTRRGTDDFHAKVFTTGAKDQPLVSVCIAASTNGLKERHFIDSLLKQTYTELEILLFDDSNANEQLPARFADLLSSKTGATVSVIPVASADRKVRRNAMAKHATGKYLLFAEEKSTELVPECIETLVSAALHTNADLLTALPLRSSRHPVSRPDNGRGYFPVGACVELGGFENCFGDGVLLVGREAFEQTSGFPDGCDPEIAIWLFLASSVMAGLSLEVVPEPLFGLAPVEPRSGSLYRSTFVGNQRRILEAFRGQKIERVMHVLESITDSERVDTQRLNEALQSVSAEARQIALKASSLYEPNSDDAVRGFLQFCIERRKVEEAFDFALYNRRSLLADAIASTKLATETLSLDAVRRHTLDFWHTVSLTDDVRQRIKPVAGVRTGNFSLPSTGIVAHPIQTGLVVFKAAAACPPFVNFVSAIVAVPDAVRPSTSVALVATTPNARLRLSGEGLESSEAFWWSRWIPANDGTRNIQLMVQVVEPVDQVLDLHFLCKIDEDVSSFEGQVKWESVAASVSVAGVMTASVIETAEQTTPVAREVIAEGVLLSENPDFPFPVFVPGDPTLLHPLPGRASLVRLPGAVPIGTNAVRSVVSLELADAHPTLFAAWVKRSSSTAATISDFTPADAFSGWFSVRDTFRRHSFTVKLDETSDEAMDLYLATRVVEYPDVHFCHAVWHELLLVQ